MHIHILGICGTFMGGIAAIAKELGHKVTGSDQNVYPPMSTQLEKLGISLTQGWGEEQFKPLPDVVIIGNALSRGNEAVEYVLSNKIPYTSGPEWLKNNLLQNRWVLAVAGTHGKTTTTSMLTWILSDAGFNPGYLIGGVPGNLELSATAGVDPFFVIEADEYDTAFFDKRSKFVHYLPNTLILNNLEFDHADIFDDLNAIKRQFHHMIRTVPANGLILNNADDENVTDTLKLGCWTETQSVAVQGDADWQVNLLENNLGNKDGSTFEILLNKQILGTVSWEMSGQHNVYNGVMAIAAARHAGMDVKVAIQSLNTFKTPKRRMEQIYSQHDITIYDDFAHHPTAIATTLAGLRNKVGNSRIIAVLEPRSNTMKMGIHKDTLADSWQEADKIFLCQNPQQNWHLTEDNKLIVLDDVEQIVSQLVDICAPNDHIVIMSNGGFNGIHIKLTDAINRKFNKPA
ncbi:UDP-N-acetylmuramate:L-alanyl-gamma-D-glutamyl-meso-diaminopimelate ligase [uncultured Psychrosphaera sp.]|jgi:UDP-N-acetylmuramate: L-alanyl-gamma-D-glutamyl-meso-diaminopimelate ligase|uniref:UDP-N-acetylmuramate:L-alanyl-gamma-D-glutamyl- meso-diaminopimelate ligase n=1 Tax=uncultured Psychrosphaera sp. TaxID=1403522 RepID=UPI00260F8330|nr:UDP-N-acetylmuramate:L-alanyl-gamma-D-glutamyl-meso-diaminopimelate ligase [uncultured Psychrosphaera sp.]